MVVAVGLASAHAGLPAVPTESHFNAVQVGSAFTGCEPCLLLQAQPSRFSTDTTNTCIEPQSFQLVYAD